VAGFIFLPVVTDETVYLAEKLNEGRIHKLEDGQAAQVGSDPEVLCEDEVGLSAVFVTYASPYVRRALVKVEGLHDDFVKLSTSGEGFSIEGGLIKQVLAKAEDQGAKVELVFGQTKEPYTVLAPKWTGVRKAIRRIVGKGVLRNLTAADKLYVLAHGYFLSDEDEDEGGGSVRVGAARGATRVDNKGPSPIWTGGKQKLYSAEQLARALTREGLPTDFKTLHLFACGGGLERTDTGRTFAQDLKTALAPTHTRIRVYAYLGNVAPTYNSQDLPPDHGTNPRYAESSNPQQRGKTAAYHKGIKVKAMTYPAKSMRVEF
jgi:hypothetical protein